MINVLIVEDSEIQRKNLYLILSRLSIDLKIYEADDKEIALKIAKKNLINFFLVDIELKQSSGIDFAMEIRKMKEYKYSWIIFITTYINYMIKSFKEIHCYDYILKPYDSKDIEKICEMILDNSYNNEISNNRTYVLFDHKGIKLKIFLDEILFIEVTIGKCVIHTKIEKYIINRVSLKNVLKMINCDYIVQCHKSCAVNIKYIRKIEKYSQISWNIYFDNYEYYAFMGAKYRNKILQLMEYNSSIY